MPLCLAFGALLHAMTPKQVGFHAVMISILGSVQPIVCFTKFCPIPKKQGGFFRFCAFECRFLSLAFNMVNEDNFASKGKRSLLRKLSRPSQRFMRWPAALRVSKRTATRQLWGRTSVA